MKSIKILPFVLFMICLLFVNLAMAGGGPIPPDPGVPIDGGLSLLLAAGAGYGINKLRKNRQNKAAKDEEIN